MSKPIISIIMGSDSDLEIMSKACEILDHFNISYECTIVSAHRTPQRLFQYATTAQENGIQIIIAGAGGAAHLPGMIASLTEIPVIGIPIKLNALDGMDSLLSIVQMPKGIPVATVAINNSTNGALLAIRMLGINNMFIKNQMKNYMKEQEKEVHDKINNLKDVGWSKYLLHKKNKSQIK